MPKALRRLLLALFVAAMQGVAQAEILESAARPHEANGVSWTDSLRQRVRRSIVFDISKDPRDESRSIGCVVFHPPGLVLMTKPE